MTTAIDAADRLTATGRAFLKVRAEKQALEAQLAAIRAALDTEQRALAAAGNYQTTRVAESALQRIRLAGWPPATTTEVTP